MTKEIGTSALLDTWGSSVVPGYASEKIPDLSKITQGWQLGERPPHEFMNWLQNQFGQKINHALSRGVADWNADTLYLVGSLARHDGRAWMSFVENSNSEPSSANSDWSVVQDERSSVVTEDILVEVGSGGDFPTISAAIAELSRMQRGYSAGLLTAEIRLRAGFVMEESIFAIGVDLGWLTVTGVDAETGIARDALTELPGASFQSFSAWGASLNGVLPTIGQLFTMDTSGSGSNRDGVTVNGGGVAVEPGAGVKNAGERGLLLAGGDVVAEGSIFDGSAGDGVRVTRAGALAGRLVSAKNCNVGLALTRASRADVNSGDFSGASSTGMRAAEGALINCPGANCRKGAEDSSSDIVVQDGGTIVARGSGGNAIGGTNVTPNEITSSGIIYR